MRAIDRWECPDCGATVPSDFRDRPYACPGAPVGTHADARRVRYVPAGDVVAFVRRLAGSGYPERVGKLHDLADDIEREFGPADPSNGSSEALRA